MHRPPRTQARHLTNKEIKHVLSQTKHLHQTNFAKLTRPELHLVLKRVDRITGGDWRSLLSGVRDKARHAINKQVSKLPDVITNRLSVRMALNPKVIDLMRQYGSQNIVDMACVREPIKKGVEIALNLITLGKYGKNQKRLNYDTMFHLFLRLTLASGTVIRFERNQVIEARVEKNLNPRDDMMKVPLKGMTTNWNSLWQNTFKQIGDRIFVYDAITNNCQKFVRDVLASNGLLNPQLELFIVQDAEAVVPEFADWIGRGVTDLAAQVDHLIYGGAFNPYIHGSPQTRAEQDAAVKQEMLGHAQDALTLASNIENRDLPATLNQVTGLVQGVAGPAAAMGVPLATGLASLISGYNPKTYNPGMYLRDALSVIPVIGPELEKLVPGFVDRSTPPWEPPTYIGRLQANPTSATHYDGYGQNADWKYAYGLSPHYQEGMNV